MAGAREEFIFVGRLDNLAMSYCAVRALIDAFPDEGSLNGQDAVKAVALFDHEEVGSSSAQGVFSMASALIVVQGHYSSVCLSSSALHQLAAPLFLSCQWLCMLYANPAEDVKRKSKYMLSIEGSKELA